MTRQEKGGLIIQVTS